MKINYVTILLDNINLCLYKTVYIIRKLQFLFNLQNNRFTEQKSFLEKDHIRRKQLKFCVKQL